MNFEIDAFGTLVIAVLVLLLGSILVQKIPFLKNYNIPEPVAGGLIAALLSFILFKFFNISASFNSEIKNILMLMFFTSIGLSASLIKLKKAAVHFYCF